MNILRNWILGICAGAMICAIAQAITPKGKGAAVVRLACGFATIALLIGPIKDFNFDEYSLNIESLRRSGEDYSQSAQEEKGKLLKTVIEEESETYILDKAKEIGANNLTADVCAKVNEESGYPYPYSVELGGEAEDEQKRSLSSYIEGELGIPAQRQYWSGENGN